MSIRAAIKDRTSGLVKRETVTLPECGVEVQIRGLMAGEADRAGRAQGFKQNAITIALGTEDPATGKPFWNPNVLEDVQEIEQLHAVDALFLVREITRMSGGGKLQAMLADPGTASTQNGSSGSHSPESSAVPSGS